MILCKQLMDQGSWVHSYCAENSWCSGHHTLKTWPLGVRPRSQHLGFQSAVKAENQVAEKLPSWCQEERFWLAWAEPVCTSQVWPGRGNQVSNPSTGGREGRGDVSRAGYCLKGEGLVAEASCRPKTPRCTCWAVCGFIYSPSSLSTPRSQGGASVLFEGKCGKEARQPLPDSVLIEWFGQVLFNPWGNWNPPLFQKQADNKQTNKQTKTPSSFFLGELKKWEASPRWNSEGSPNVCRPPLASHTRFCHCHCLCHMGVQLLTCP
jgi:hypothetical protein